MKFTHASIHGTVFALAALTLAACSPGVPAEEGGDGGISSRDGDPVAQMEEGDAGVSGRNSDPVAQVNGEQIPRSEYQASLARAEQMVQLQGQDPSGEAVREQLQQQVLDDLIAAVLVRQEAERTGVTVDEAGVEEEYGRVVEQVGGEDALAAQLADAGLTADELKQTMRQQLTVQAYVQAQLAGQDLEVSDGEARAVYDEVSVQQEGLPPYEEVEAQLKAQLRQEKEQLAIRALVAGLREQAEIEILL